MDSMDAETVYSDTHTHTGTCCICGTTGSVSYRGKCKECSKRRLMENHNALMNKSGADYERWRKACLKAFGKPKRGK